MLIRRFYLLRRSLKSYVGLYKSYVGDKKSYVGDKKSYIGDKKSYVRLIFMHICCGPRKLPYLTLDKGNRCLVLGQSC